jgi:hypothetical protein
MKIGLIQTQRFGDVIIALPIAKYFADQGHEVLWPVHANYISHFAQAAPYVRFLPIMGEGDLLFDAPMMLLRDQGCERILSLYSYLRGEDDKIDKRLAKFLTFDAYKYAVAGVPFREKWNLSIVRNRAREEALYREVVQAEPYVCCHLEASFAKVTLDPTKLPAVKQTIEITPRTDCIFDWLTVIERASMLVMIDSCYANLVDQLKLPNRKAFIPKVANPGSPILAGDWEF